VAISTREKNRFIIVSNSYHKAMDIVVQLRTSRARQRDA
jgi:hypothetical protein